MGDQLLPLDHPQRVEDGDDGGGEFQDPANGLHVNNHNVTTLDTLLTAIYGRKLMRLCFQSSITDVKIGSNLTKTIVSAL